MEIMAEMLTPLRSIASQPITCVGLESSGGNLLTCCAARRSRRTIDFAYDPDEDTPERVADEITSLFELSSTDRDICAAALKEWLAKELPDNDSS